MLPAACRVHIRSIGTYQNLHMQARVRGRSPRAARRFSTPHDAIIKRPSLSEAQGLALRKHDRRAKPQTDAAVATPYVRERLHGVALRTVAHLTQSLPGQLHRRSHAHTLDEPEAATP